MGIATRGRSRQSSGTHCSPSARTGARKSARGGRIGALLALPLAASLALQAPAARALVPYVYLPENRDLEGAGLGIAQAAARLLRLGQAEDAARLAALTVRLLPNDPRGWILLAEAELRSDQAEQAQKALARAKQLQPDNAGIWMAEGSLALRNNQPAQAAGLLQRGIALDPRNSGAYFDLGNAQILLREPNRALVSFERAAGIRPDFWEAINNQGLVLYEMGRSEEALQRWRKVLRIKPGVAETSLAMAAALHSRGAAADRGDAIRLASQSLAEDPNYVLASYRKEQLWGERLQAATQALLAIPELKASVDRANANATPPEKKAGQTP